MQSLKIITFQGSTDDIKVYDTTKEGHLRLIKEKAISFASHLYKNTKDYEEQVFYLAFNARKQNATIEELETNLNPNVNNLVEQANLKKISQSILQKISGPLKEFTQVLDTALQIPIKMETKSSKKCSI